MLVILTYKAEVDRNKFIQVRCFFPTLPLLVVVLQGSSAFHSPVAMRPRLLCNLGDNDTYDLRG